MTQFITIFITIIHDKLFKVSNKIYNYMCVCFLCTYSIEMQIWEMWFMLIFIYYYYIKKILLWLLSSILCIALIIILCIISDKCLLLFILQSYHFFHYHLEFSQANMYNNKSSNLLWVVHFIYCCKQNIIV